MVTTPDDLGEADDSGDQLEEFVIEGGEDDAIVSRPRPVLCCLQKPEELDDRVPLGHAAEELTGSMLMILINQSEAEYTREYHKGEVRMVSGLVEVFLPGPLLHHAAEDGQLVEAAPGENLCVPGHQEIVTRPECLVTIIAVASRQPPGPGAVTSTEASSGPAKGDNSVVFHVATQAMISQPTASDNLEVSILSG